MRIINLKEFLKLPEGTLYVKFDPVLFDELSIKESSISDLDWIYSPIINVDAIDSADIYGITNESLVEGSSFDLDINCTTREGMYDESQLFAVYEKSDVKQLIQKLNDSLERAYE